MPTWGDPWGNLWGSEPPQSVVDLANMRTQQYGKCAYVLFIEGIQYAWVTDHSDARELEGSGASSWIGAYESAAGLPYSKTILGGLVLPKSFKSQPDLDLNTGMFRTSNVTFTLMNHDGILPQLFAQEGKDNWRLGQRIPPGNAAQAMVRTRRLTPGSFDDMDAEWVAAGACYVNTETLGPAGQRMWWPCMPDQRYGGWGVTWVGMEHATWQDGNFDNIADSPNGPPRVRISFDPLVFEGRRAALYRIYKDPTISGNIASAWPHWGLNHDPGNGIVNLVWFGTLRDTGQISEGGLKWKVSCFGQESWLKRQLGTKVHNKGMVVGRTTIDLKDEQRYVAIEFGTDNLSANPATRSEYDSLSFVTRLAAQYSNVDSLHEAVQTICNNIRDGSVTSDYGGPTTMAAAGRSFEFNRDGARIIADSSIGTYESVYAKLTMHEKVWRWLGWDPALQFASPDQGTEKWQLSQFQYRNAGESVTQAAVDGGASDPATPGDGYIQVWFTTFSREDGYYRNNDNKWKEYENLYGKSDVIILGDSDSLTFSVTDDRQYIPDDPLVPIGNEDIVAGTGQEYSRYMLFKGLRLEGIPSSGQIYDDNGNLLEEVESTPFYQWAMVGWDGNSEFGFVNDPGDLGGPTFRIIQWMNPRSIGYNYDVITGNEEWAALASGDGAIQALPISVYSYNWNEDHETAWTLFPMLLLSTGTATQTGQLPIPIYSPGTNTNGEANLSFAAANDTAAADMGLGIPNEMVAPNGQIRSQFSAIQSNKNGFNRVRYAYGPDGFESYKMIESLIRPRGMHLTLRNNQFGVQQWTFNPDDVEQEITQSDLRGMPGDGGQEVRPTQSMRATGQVDLIRFTGRKLIDEDPPEEKRIVNEFEMRARDANSDKRAGDKVVDLFEHGWQQDGRFRIFWAFEMAEFFSRRHFIVNGLRVDRTIGQDLYIGSRVRISNPWIVDTAGNTGITGAFGIIVGVTFSYEHEVYICDVLVYAGQFGDGPRVFFPIGKISSISGADIVLEQDFLGLGEGNDSAGFGQQSWMSGDASRVAILSFDRSTWTLGSETELISSVSGNTVTVGSAFSSPPNANHDRYLVLIDYDTQGSTSWARNHGNPICLDTGEFGSGPTPGFPYEDKK